MILRFYASMKLTYTVTKIEGFGGIMSVPQKDSSSFELKCQETIISNINMFEEPIHKIDPEWCVSKNISVLLRYGKK